MNKVATVCDGHPLSISGLLSTFLGFANYYNRFISNFARTAVPISNLLSGKCEFVWGDEQSSAFGALKLKFMAAPMLILPSFE